MNKLWCVLLFDRALKRTDAIYHEYGALGQTACGKHFYFTMRIEADSRKANWVHRKNAERFARPCKRCWKRVA